MAIIHESTREITCKVVYHGTGMCGKTTSLMYLNSHLPESQRGRFISLETPTERTLYFDFLPVITEARGYKFRYLLFTTPGQDYYEASRKLVLKGADGLVLVVDSHRTRLHENLSSFQLLNKSLLEMEQKPELLPTVFQYNKRDLSDIIPLDEAEKRFNPGKFPSYPAIARTGQGVYETFLTVARRSLAKLTAPEGEARMGPLFRSTVISLEDDSAFAALLERLNHDSGSFGSMLVDESSGTLARCGEIPAKDFESMGALLACNFTAAQELSHNLSRSGFTGIVQKGPQWSMMATRVDSRRFIVVFYPGSRDPQQFRAVMATAKRSLATALTGVDARSQGRLKAFAQVFTSVNRIAVAGLGGGS